MPDILLTQLDNGNLCIVAHAHKTDTSSDNANSEFSETVQMPLAKAEARAFA